MFANRHHVPTSAWNIWYSFYARRVDPFVPLSAPTVVIDFAFVYASLFDNSGREPFAIALGVDSLADIVVSQFCSATAGGDANTIKAAGAAPGRM